MKIQSTKQVETSAGTVERGSKVDLPINEAITLCESGMAQPVVTREIEKRPDTRSVEKR